MSTYTFTNRRGFFYYRKSLLEDADFPLSSTFIDKNMSEDSCSSCNQTESVLEENCNQTDMTVNHLKQLENELLGKSKDYYQLHEKIPCLMTSALEWFDSDVKVLFYTGLPNREMLECVFNFVNPQKNNISIQHLLIFRNLA